MEVQEPLQRKFFKLKYIVGIAVNKVLYQREVDGYGKISNVGKILC